MGKFIVTIQFTIDDQFMTLVPPHRTYINYLINKGIIDSYVVSLETQRSWIIFNANNKSEIDSYINKSPLIKYWTFEIDELYIYDGQSYRFPKLEFN